MQSLRPFALGLLVIALVALSQGLPVDNQAGKSVESVFDRVEIEKVADESLVRKERDTWEHSSNSWESNSGISFGFGTDTGSYFNHEGGTKHRYETERKNNDGTVVSHGQEYGHAYGGSYNPWYKRAEYTTKSWFDIW